MVQTAQISGFCAAPKQTRKRMQKPAQLPAPASPATPQQPPITLHHPIRLVFHIYHQTFSVRVFQTNNQSATKSHIQTPPQ